MWKGNVKIDLKEMGYEGMDWIYLCCATNRKVAGSIPAGVIAIFH